MYTIKVINEKTHSISAIWLVKNFIYTAIFTSGFLLFTYFVEKSKCRSTLDYFVTLFFIIVFQVVVFISLFLRKINFQYEFKEKSIILKQGVFSRSERQVLYGRIQNIVISQDFIDKCLRLASLTIETASDGGGVKLAVKDSNEKGLGYFWLGFYSNAVLIPGLLYADALEFKKFIMEQIKENPIDDAQSGL